MKSILFIASTLCLFVATAQEAHAGATVIKTVEGNCDKQPPGVERFKTKYYIDADDDGKADYLRVVWCDGKTTMTKPIVIGTNNLDANHTILFADYGNTHLGDEKVWFEGPVKNEAGQTVGGAVKDSTSIECSVTFFSQIHVSDEELAESSVHPEQNFLIARGRTLLFRPTMMGMNCIVMSPWTGDASASHLLTIFVDQPLTENIAYTVNVDDSKLDAGLYSVTVYNGRTILLNGTIELE